MHSESIFWSMFFIAYVHAAMLQGRFVPLKLGFVGVVNRSQRDITTQKTIRDAWYVSECMRVCKCDSIVCLCVVVMR